MRFMNLKQVVILVSWGDVDRFCGRSDFGFGVEG